MAYFCIELIFKAMKRMFNQTGMLLLSSILFAFGQSSKAEVPENVKLKVLSDQRIAIYVQNPLKQQMSLVIKNSVSDAIEYNAEIQASGYYNRIYNLSNLPEGGYTVIFTIDNTVYEKEILLKSQGSELLAETKYEAPTVHLEDNSVYLTVINHENEKVSVTFWKNAEHFFTDTPIVNTSFKRQYNLSRLEPGEYAITVLTGDKDYTYPIEVK
jgi:hypothetical protein